MARPLLTLNRMQNQASGLPDDTTELLTNFEALPAADRARILSLVRNLRALGEVVMGGLQRPISATAQLA